MKHLWRLLCAALVVGQLVFPLSASAGTVNGITTTNPIAASYCSMTAASSLGLSTCGAGIPAGATCILATPTGAAVNWRDDGTAPTATLGSGGQPVAALSSMWYCGKLSALRFIEQSASTLISVSFYK